MADRTEEPGKGTAALLAPAAVANRGPRRSPTTGHVRRRPHTPEPAVSATRSPRGTRSEGGPDEDAATTTEESEDGRPRPRDRGARPKRAAERGKQVAKRSQSQPSAALEPQRQSTSEDDEDYWHAYFAIQSKNIAKHNGSSLAAAAAGVLRPGPVRKKAEPGAVTRKSTAERGRVMERRPSAPSFATERDDVVVAEPEAEPLPPTPKPVLRRRAPRDKSRGAAKEGPAAPPPHAASPAPASISASALGESASETSSNTSKTSKADKSIIWRKWSQAPEPTKKEVLSIDPAEVLRGLGLVEEDDPNPEPAVEAEVESVLEPEPEHTEVDSKLEPNGDGFPNRDRKSSERLSKEKKESKQAGEVVRKSSLRKERPRGDRKASLTDVKPTDKPVEKPAEKRSWLSRLFGRKPQAKHAEAKDKAPRPKVNWLVVLGDLRVEWQAFRQNHPAELMRMRAMGHRCCAALLLMMLYCGAGGLVFRFIEGSFESFYKCGVKRVKRDFIDALWTTSHNLREDEWKSRARRRLWEFEEQLHAAHEAGVTSYSGMRSWSFLNAVVYCLTVVTTIGYGHISPSTNTGRAVTIIYAIFGIPMFLILLADFGKLFTRGIKFVWSFVRRLYYTGSCRKVRRTQPVQEIMKGAQIMYDLATFRRPSMLPQEDPDPNAQDGDVEQADTPLRPEPHPPFVFRRDPADSSEPPATPAPSAFEVDDEFNLPISVAIVILLLYLFIGASIYYIWESWGFFESFYFVFISMSTIGFGDFVPQHPMYMMASIVYLVFGLALTSMCINVVQEKLSDSFRQASAKIGATIGLRMAEQEDASTNPGTPGNGPVEDEEVVERTDSKEVTS